VRMELVRRMGRRAADRHDARQEGNDGVAENVVAVSRNHMRGVGNADELAMRTQAKKLARTLFGEDVRHAAAHEQRRQLQIAGARLETQLTLREIVLRGPLELRVPMPAISAIRSQADVLAQPLQVSRTRALRLIA